MSVVRGGCLPVVGVVALVTIPAGIVLGVASVNSPMLLLALPLLPIGAVVLAVVLLPLVAHSGGPTVTDKEHGRFLGRASSWQDGQWVEENEYWKEPSGKIVRRDPPPVTSGRWVGSGDGRRVTPHQVTPKPGGDPTFEEQCARMERGEMSGPELADFINTYGTEGGRGGRRGRRRTR